MTGFPPPSDRPERPSSATFALFWPVLAAVGALSGVLALLVLTAPKHVEVAEIAPEAPPLPHEFVVETAPEPPPVGPSDWQTAQVEPAEPPASDRYDLELRLERGDTVEKLLRDIGIVEADAKQIAEKLQAMLKKTKLPVGETIDFTLQSLPDQPDAPRLLSLTIRPVPEREYIITRNDDGSYSGEEKIYKISPRIVRVSTEIHGTLHASGVKAGAPASAMNEFIKALSYDVDFQRELKNGTDFTVVLEQQVTSDGRITHHGRLLMGEVKLAKRTVTVVRFRPQGGADQFFNPEGESVVRSFLRTPMDVSKVTSRFGMRDHPILGYSAMHTGVDFGAPMGTPVLAAGAGKVKMAGWNGGYGLYVRLDHTAQVGTGYGHLSRLGPGIKPGVSVRQGQVIGFVGSTGMSTGPHLHYEFYKANAAVNPLTQKYSMRNTLAGKDLGTFQKLVRDYRGHSKSAPQAVQHTPAPPPPPANLAKGD